MLLTVFTKQEIGSAEREGMRYYDALYHFALNKLNGNKEMAQQCVQDTYLAFEEALKSKKIEIEECKSWLYGTMRIRIQIQIKDKMYQNEHVVGLENMYDQGYSPELFGKRLGVAEIVEQSENQRNLVNKVCQLKKSDRRLLIEVYFNDKKLTEVAAEEGISESAVKKRHERLKSKLLKIYKGNIPEAYLRRAAK